MEKWVKDSKKTTCPLCRSDLRKVYKKYEKEIKRKQALDLSKNNLKKKIAIVVNQPKGKKNKRQQNDNNLADGFAEEVIVHRRRKNRRNRENAGIISAVHIPQHPIGNSVDIE